jgi:autotransporter-associated beta strand protein
MKPTIHPLFRSALLPSLLALGHAPSATAADITWGSATTITGDAGSGIAVKNFQPNNNATFNSTTGTADISSAGTSVFAMNFTGVSGDSWINRVTFFESTPQETIFRSADEAGALTQNGVTLSFGPGWIGNTRIAGNSPQGSSYGTNPGFTWDTLSYMRYMNDTSGTLTFSGLTIGQEYAVQYWVQDSRTGLVNINDRNLTLAGATPVILDYNNGAGVGQWAIGTFTADSTSQTINITANSSVQANMLQLRALPAPFTAADGVWIGGDGDWGTASNWDAATIGQGIDKSATFNGLAPITAAVNVIRPIGALLFSGANHTLSNGAGSLKLDGDTTYPTPTVSVAAGITATVNAALTGNDGLLKSGTGTLALGGISSYTGTTSITAGTLAYQGVSFTSTTHGIASGAVLEFNVAGGTYNAGSTTINGAGTLRKTGAGTLIWPASSATFALDPGALIDVREGAFTAGSFGNENWALNASDLNVDAGAVFSTVEANVRVDKITGSGSIGTGFSGAGYQNLTIGVADGSSSFSGAITNTDDNPAFVGNLVKEGTGTITLAGLNTFTGNTTINGGTLELADNAQLSFVVTDSSSNRIGGSGVATLRGDFAIDTSAVTATTGGFWTLVDLTTLAPTSSFESTFTVVGFVDPENDGIWTMSDAKGDWSFNEATGELGLDVGNDYDDWGAAFGLAPGSEAGDADNDGLTNEEEYAFGLLPNSGASVNPITAPLDKATGTFSYQRRDNALTGLTYTVWFSENLTNWTQDSAAAQPEGTPDGNGVETINVTLSALPGNPLPAKLFIQVRAN